MKEEKESKTGIKFLRWPWNIVIYIALILALRIFSIPVIAFLIWLQQKNNPHGAAEGYCLSRTRKRLLWVLWAVLLFLISAALGVWFYMEGQQERFDWRTEDYLKWIFSGLAAAAFFAGGVYMGYVGIRDAFFPAKSSLAKSIRAQLPFPEESPPVENLFAMVDDDLNQYGRWFDAVGIGKEWILGEQANRIERIRGIFVVDEIHHSQTQTGVRTSRKLQLVLIDNRWHKSVTDFKNPKELQAAADYIALLEPDALRGRNSQYLDFLHYDNLKQEEFERNFQQKKSKRETERILNDSFGGVSQGMPTGNAVSPFGVSQEMILRQSDGSVTSRVTASLVEERLQQCLAGNETDFTLTPTRPIKWNQQLCQNLRCLSMRNSDKVLLIIEVTPLGGGKKLSMEQIVALQQAERILRNWLMKQAPNLTEWKERMNIYE